MRRLLFMALVIAACKKGGPQGATTKTYVPGDMLPETVASLDKGEIELYLAGAEFGFEKYEVAKQSTNNVGLHAETLWGSDRWMLDLTYRPEDWSLLAVVIQKHATEGGGTACSFRLREKDGQMEWLVENGSESQLLGKQPGEWLYWITQRPVVTLFAACARSGVGDQIIQSTPGGSITLGGWVNVDVNGKQLHKVTMGTTGEPPDAELFCDEKTFAFYHRSAGAFVATRPEYRDYAKALGKSDPTDKPFPGKLDCE